MMTNTKIITGVVLSSVVIIGIIFGARTGVVKKTINHTLSKRVPIEEAQLVNDIRLIFMDDHFFQTPGNTQADLKSIDRLATFSTICSRLI